MANCTKGKSCGASCVAPAYSCKKSLNEFAALFEALNNSLDRRRDEERIEAQAVAEEEAERRVSDFMFPTEDEVLPELTQEEKDFREAKVNEAESYLFPGFGKSSGPNSLVTYEDKDVDWKDVVRTGKFLGSGSYGAAYAKGDVVVKIGDIQESEIKMGVEASKLGIGPKIYQGPATGHRGRSVVVMERIQGQEFHRFETDMDKYPPAFQVKVADSFYDTMKTMHRAGMVHNDLNSGNVLVQKDGSVKFIDFAFANKKSQDMAGEEAYQSLLVDMAQRPNVWVSPKVEGFVSRVSDIAENDYDRLADWPTMSQLYDQH